MFKENKMKAAVERKRDLVVDLLNHYIKGGGDPNDEISGGYIAQKVILNELLREFKHMGV